jgi:hypothetical protein
MLTQPVPTIKKNGKRNGITMRRHSIYHAYTRTRNKHAYHFLNSAGKLGEMFTCDQAIKADRFDLEYQRQVLQKLSYRKITQKALHNMLKKRLATDPKLTGKDLGSVYTIPAKFPGSRAFFRKAYADLLTVVRVHGAPT